MAESESSSAPAIEMLSLRQGKRRVRIDLCFSDKIGKQKVSNLLYIDDLKIYASDDKQMERCKAVVKEFGAIVFNDFSFFLDRPNDFVR